MNKKSLQNIAVILCLNLLFGVFSFAQDRQKIVTVKDEDGNPVPGATVLVGEGVSMVQTDENGEFFMPLGTLVPVYIEAGGFEPQLIKSQASLELTNIVLLKAPYHMGQQDQVHMPFGTFSKRQITGATTVLSPQEILGYDQAVIEDVLTGRVPGMFGSASIRGMGAPLIVIDGIPRPASDLNLQQIEQITVVKDLATAMMYGSQASNGVILITTRRGEPLKRTIKFTAENGYNKPISYPEYLGASEYMELYNEALANDGLAPKFSSSQISNTQNGTDPVQYPDEDYYTSTYLKNWASYKNVVGEASGGNEIAQYYLNLGWNRNNGFLKIGEGDMEKNDRLNMRGNIDYRLSDVIKLRFDGAVLFNISRGPRYSREADFWGLSSTLHPEYYPVLIPASLITDSTLAGAVKLVDDQYVLGGTSEYQTNIHGEMTMNGPSRMNQRLIQMRTGLDFDLSSLTEGLTASVYLSFDIYNMFRTDLLNTYAVYKPNYVGDSLYFSKYGVDTKVDAQTVTDESFYRRTGVYGILDYKRRFGDHDIKATALGYRDQFSNEGVLQPTKHLHFGTRANYVYQNKIVAELTGVIAGSTKLYETEPYSFSPGIGLGWIVSEESFMQDNSLINYLKVRANWAIHSNDEAINNFYLGRDYYDEGSVYMYNHRNADNVSRILSAGNPGLGWEKQMNINIGFQSMFFDYRLGLEGSYFFNKSYDLLSQRLNLIPVYISNLPFDNFGSEKRQGVELGLNYRANIGDLEIKIGGDLVYSVPKVLEIDELDYQDEYRKKTGKPTDAMFGFVAQGLFRDQTDIDNSPVQSFGSVQPGDIKYEDLNGDNVINEEDQKMIGNEGPRIGFGLRANLRYRAFELFILAFGQSGQNSIFRDPYYWVYGNRKYSKLVTERWTPETASTASYPRLSSTSNANNFINSTFWLHDNNWFKLQTVQLTYSLQTNDFAGLDEVRFFLRGYNLLKFSKIKDKTDLNIGSAPQTRDISLGLTLQF